MSEYKEFNPFGSCLSNPWENDTAALGWGNWGRYCRCCWGRRNWCRWCSSSWLYRCYWCCGLRGRLIDRLNWGGGPGQTG